MTNLLKLQALILQRCEEEETKDTDLAALTRSWCLLEERRRILRGVPLPGQLRPDLDPVQMARMLKRARTRQPIDLDANGASLISDAPMMEEEGEEPTNATPTTHAQAIDAAKESLSAAQG